MTDFQKPIHHHDPDTTDDDALAREAHAFYTRQPQLQVVAEALVALREAQLPWWAPEDLRAIWGAQERLRWLKDRADVRQRITTALTGLPKNAARSRGPSAQAELIDAVLDHGDVTAADFEAAFHAEELVVYGPAPAFWMTFRERMPWAETSAAHQKLLARILKSLLSERAADGSIRRPVLSAWDVRGAIDGVVWHRSLPVELLVAIDEARLRQERSRPREPFHARHELIHASPELIVQHIPLADLEPVFAVATSHMRFDPSAERGQEELEAPRSLAPHSLAPHSLAPVSSPSLTPTSVERLIAAPKLAVNG